VLDLIIAAIELIFPAYCANAFPVIAGGGRPLDCGKNFVDGKPIFGKNKTFRGFFAGLLIGTGVGAAEALILDYPMALPPTFRILFGFLVAIGALLGDLAGAFVKRRLGLAPGALLPVVDQVDFVVGAIILSAPLSFDFLSWQLILAVFVITLPIHLLTNFAAYKLGLKSNPW
jgi:CDP-2,3-bis-(O-geranylgeranyl)-sn-glycerol synthase